MEEITRAYDAAAAQANKGPTLAGAVQRVGKLLPVDIRVDMDISPTTQRRVHDMMFVLAPRSRSLLRESDIVKARTYHASNLSALKEVVKARNLPLGLPPVDLRYDSPAPTPDYPWTVRHLAHALRNAALLSLLDDDPGTAWDRAADLLRLDELLARVPDAVYQLTRTDVVGFMADLAFLEIALKGDLPAAELARMASELESAQVDVAALMTKIVQLDRAEILDMMEWFENSKLDEKTRLEFLDDIARRHAGSREELAAEILAQLPQDRHAVLALYRAYEETLRQPGTRLDENPPEPLGMIGRYERVPAERIQDALLRAQVRRRSAPALLRVLASYRRTGRLPKKAEVSLPADPYVPGQRLVYESDAKRRYVAVYSRGWPNERDRPPGYRIGYGLVVPGSTKAHRDPKE